MMVGMNQIQEIGEALRKSDIKIISTESLYTLVMRETATIGKKPLRRYLEVLKQLGYIKFTAE